MTGVPRPGTVVFFHAHPDDEAIFTGGTIAHLTDVGCRVIVVVATSGDGGEGSGRNRAELAACREAETMAACSLLGVAEVAFLRYGDSGIAADTAHADAFASAHVELAARELADRCLAWKPDAMVVYDEGGIYPHPDHLQAHLVGARAARLARIPTLYQATVDHEYLHFVETHLIEEAAAALPVPSSVGVPTVMIATTVAVGRQLDRKRLAMGAHASQIPIDAPVLRLNDANFQAVYGYEWYLRDGPPSCLDQLDAVC
jgi:LmbE family N-acetylglucosaminyl deacetylase